MKSIEPDDPMELVGLALPVEDTDAMTDGVIEEYLLMGLNLKQVLHLFRHPAYQMTHQIYHDKGEDYVQSRIQAVRERWAHGWLQGEDRNG
jgi:hypothetical protein